MLKLKCCTTKLYGMQAYYFLYFESLLCVVMKAEGYAPSVHWPFPFSWTLTASWPVYVLKPEDIPLLVIVGERGADSASWLLRGMLYRASARSAARFRMISCASKMKCCSKQFYYICFNILSNESNIVYNGLRERLGSLDEGSDHLWGETWTDTLFISKCLWRWCCITAICYLDFIHRPYVF
jgi:hypothetical protein